MVKTIEIGELKNKLEEVLKDVLDNGITYIISVNTIPVAKLCPLSDKESAMGVGISYESTGLVNISEDY